MIEWLEQLRADFAQEYGPGPKVVTLATIDEENRPRARSVVVRALRDGGDLVVASDARSDKNAQVHKCGGAEVCAWLPKLRRQHRLNCRAGVIGQLPSFTSDDLQLQGLRQQVWGELSESARALFSWPSPGQSRDADPAAFPSAIRAGLPPTNFELLYLMPREVDVLDLNQHPHLRRIWRRDETRWAAVDVNP
jgi:PPOX class probable FMN-dependent enzyme